MPSTAQLMPGEWFEYPGKGWYQLDERIEVSEGIWRLVTRRGPVIRCTDFQWTTAPYKPFQAPTKEKGRHAR